jgi:hypothetical protein
MGEMPILKEILMVGLGYKNSRPHLMVSIMIKETRIGNER